MSLVLTVVTRSVVRIVGMVMSGLLLTHVGEKAK